MAFNYNHLYYFYQTAKLGGVTHAAKAPRLSQPSLSLQLKTLEAQTGLRLLRKEGRRRVLTEEGHRVYGICRSMFEAASEISDVRVSADGKRSQLLSLGVDSEIDRPFAASVVSGFLRSTKLRPQISMISSSSAELTEALRAERLDLVFTTLPSFHQDVVVLAKYNLPIVLCAGNKIAASLAPLVRNNGPFRFVADSDAGWILPSPRLRLRESIDRHFTNRRVEGRIVFESDNLAALTQAVIDNVGVSCLPLHYVRGHVAEKRIQILYKKPVLGNEALYSLTRRGHERQPLVTEFLAAARKRMLDSAL